MISAQPKIQNFNKQTNDSDEKTGRTILLEELGHSRPEVLLSDRRFSKLLVVLVLVSHVRDLDRSFSLLNSLVLVAVGFGRPLLGRELRKSVNEVGKNVSEGKPRIGGVTDLDVVGVKLDDSVGLQSVREGTS